MKFRQKQIKTMHLLKFHSANMSGTKLFSTHKGFIQWVIARSFFKRKNKMKIKFQHNYES